MPSRNIKTDETGRRWRPLSGMAEAYMLYLLGHPAEAHYKAVQAVYREAGKEITAQQASRKAVVWDKNPHKRDMVAMFLKKYQAEPAIESRDRWAKRVRSRGVKAEGDGDYGTALRSDDMMAKYGLVDGLTPGQGAEVRLGDTFNFNGPNPFMGWSLEELAAWREEHRAKVAEGKVVNTDAS